MKLPRIRRRLTLRHDGMDLHDHPWSFVSIVLTGGYTEQTVHVDRAVPRARAAEAHPDLFEQGVVRDWLARTIHRMPLTVAHRITSAAPGTWTIVLRGPTRRVWGFYLPTGRVPWTEYDYATRRPSSLTVNK